MHITLISKTYIMRIKKRGKRKRTRHHNSQHNPSSLSSYTMYNDHIIHTNIQTIQQQQIILFYLFFSAKRVLSHSLVEKYKFNKFF